MNPIEKVSRALCKERGFEPDQEMSGIKIINKKQVEIPILQWKFLIPEAKVAIEAMRIPTDEMLSAIHVYDDAYDAKRNFTTMIDKALEQADAS